MKLYEAVKGETVEEIRAIIIETVEFKKIFLKRSVFIVK